MVALSIAHLIQNLLLKLLDQRSLGEIQDYKFPEKSQEHQLLKVFEDY